MKSNILNKSIAIVLSVTLVSSQVSAMGFSDLVGTATTRASVWSSPATGEKFFYSGSYEFTFNGGKNYAPWVNTSQAGGINVGCGGISIKGMFMSMIGLDKIKDQLSGAGATLGWGVMLALISSMPIFDQTFKRLRKWGRTIQALLQNACQIGKNIGNKLFSEPMKNFQKKAIGSDSYLGKVDKGIDGTLGIIEDGFKDIANKVSDCGFGSKESDLSVDQRECQATLGMISAKQVSKVSKAKSASIFNHAIGKQFDGTNVNVVKNEVFVDKLSNFLSSGNISNQTVIADSDSLKNAKNIIILSRLFFGDFAYSSDTIKEILKNTTASDGLKVGAYKPDKDKLEKQMKAAVAGTKSNFEPSYAYIAPIFDAKNAANVFINGIKEDSCSNKKGECSNGSVKINDSYILFGSFTNNTTAVNTASIDPASSTTSSSSTNSVSEVNIVLGSSTPIDTPSTSDTMTVEWGGAIAESLKSIKKAVKSKSGKTPIYGMFDESDSSNYDGETDGNIPLVVPGIGKYIEIIAKIEKASKAETAFTASLKEMLAKYNAYLYSKSLLGYISGFVISGMGDAQGGADIKNMNILLTNIKSATKGIQKVLDDEIGDLEKFNTLVQTFEKIDRDFKININNIIN